MQRFLSPLLVLATIAMGSHAAHARDQIRMVGSSTVFPFAAAAAEQLGQGGQFKTPIVEATGTGGGFKLFCSGVGLTTPDMTGASRRITAGERESCAKHGVMGVTEIPIGYDGIVLAHGLSGRPFSLSKKELFLALALKVPAGDGSLVPNHYTHWDQINSTLPRQKIEVYGPPPTSGTRDAFVEMVMEEACKQLPAFAQAEPDEKKRKKICGLLREDGGFIDAGEDDNVIVQKLSSNEHALGIFGYGFLQENLGTVRALNIDGVSPSAASIEDGSYKVARSLYVYVKNAHVGIVPGMQAFAQELVGQHAVGPEGYLVDKGLLPLHTENQRHARAQAASLKFLRPPLEPSASQ